MLSNEYKEKEQVEQERQFVPFPNSDKGTNFSDRLKKVIGNRSGREFAKAVGMSYSTLHNYLIGASSPTLDNLIALSKHSGVDLNWLATGEDSQRNIKSEHTETYQAYSGKDSITISRKRLEAAIETLEEVLRLTRKTMKPKGKVEMIFALYELLTDEDPNQKQAQTQNLMLKALELAA